MKRAWIFVAAAWLAVPILAQEDGAKKEEGWVPLEDPAPTEAATSAEPAEEPAKSEPEAAAEPEKAPAPVPMKEAPKAPSARAAAPAAAAPADLGPEERASAEWRFLKQAAEDKRPETAETVLAQVARLTRARPEADFADEALRLRGELFERLGDAKAAVVSYLRLLTENPASKSAFPAKRAMMDLVDKRIDRKLKGAFGELSKGGEGGDKPARLAALFSGLVEKTGDALYEPLVGEFEEFFGRFPEYAKLDDLQLLLGQLHARKGKHQAAILAYQKLLAVYPASAHRPRAQRMIADVLAQNLKDYNRAIDAYQEVANRYPESEEAGLAYDQIAKIEESLKQYDLAIDIYDKIIKLYPGTDAALKAFNGKALLLADKLARPTEAIEAYGKLADMFKDGPAAKALKAAAAIARKQKDYSTELAQHERLAKEAPETPEAPEALYAAAEICEEQLQSPEKAVELYNQLAAKYAAHKLAKKARGRAAALAKGK